MWSPRPDGLLCERETDTSEEASARHHPRHDDERVARDGRSVDEFDTRKVIVRDGERCNAGVDHADVARRELLSFLGGRWRGVAEVGDVVAQLAEQQCLMHRAWSGDEDADALVAYFPTVAIGAMKHIVPPPLTDSGHVG